MDGITQHERVERTSVAEFGGVSARTIRDRGELRVLAAFTIGRLTIVPIVVLGIASREPLVGALALLAFMVADYFDGVFARSWNSDGATRRAIDSVVDRLAIWIVLSTLSVVGILAPLLLLIWLARDAYCVYWPARVMKARRVVIGADWPYRALNVSLGLWAIAAPFVSAEAASVSFAGVLLVAFAVAADLRNAGHGVLLLPPGVRGVVIPAGAFRTKRHFAGTVLRRRPAAHSMEASKRS